MKTIKKRNNIIGLIFCFIVIGALNVNAQNNNDTIAHSKTIQPPPPYDPTDPDITVNELYANPDTMARFRGNIKKYFADSIRYPEDAKEKRLQGIVFLNVIIEKDGSISNITVVRSPSNSLSAEAKRVVSTMPKWLPGRQNGKAVRVQCMIPVHFNLPPATDSAPKH